MNKFENWFLRRVIAREVRQGYHHARNIQNLYQMIHDACRTEFCEDHAVTLNTFLQELFDKTQPK